MPRRYKRTLTPSDWPAHLTPLSPAQIRFLRICLGLSQRKFADLLMVARFTVWRWEAGRHTKIARGSTFTMRKLAAGLALPRHGSDTPAARSSLAR